MRLARILLPLLMPLLVSGGTALAKARPSDAITSPTSTFYASVSGGGVYRSGASTSTWATTASLPADALAVAVGDAAHWRAVYAGTQGGGYVSHDGGVNWNQTLRVGTVRDLLVPAQSPQTVLAATDHGLYISVNYGMSWTQDARVTRAVSMLTQAPQNPAILYMVGTSGMWTSRNGGQRWTTLRRVPWRTAPTGLAVSGTDPSVLFVATSQGLWRNASGAWTLLRNGLPTGRFSAVVTDGGRVFAASTSGGALYMSSDSGNTWSVETIGGVVGGITALAQDPQQGGTLILGDGSGNVQVSTDDGATWTDDGAVAGAAAGPVLSVTAVHRVALPVDGVADPRQPGVRYSSNNGGHTLREPFLSYWQSASGIIGSPETEAFVDSAHGGVRAQYFANMELLQEGDKVVPAPLGLENLPAGYDGKGSYDVDRNFAPFAKAHSDLLGPPVTPALKLSTGDGSGRTYLVQYFRNARLEYHSEYGDPSLAVQVGKLGEKALQRLGWL